MFDEGPVPWPVAAAVSDSWLVLDAECAADQVGLFVATLAARIDVASPGGRDEVVDALLAEELLIVAGGLQLSDTEAGTVVVPGLLLWSGGLAGMDPGPHRRFAAAGA